jgi:hypothetical protein
MHKLRQERQAKCVSVFLSCVRPPMNTSSPSLILTVVDSWRFVSVGELLTPVSVFAKSLICDRSYIDRGLSDGWRQAQNDTGRSILDGLNGLRAVLRIGNSTECRHVLADSKRACVPDLTRTCGVDIALKYPRIAQKMRNQCSQI